jgi:hypothetical protein
MAKPNTKAEQSEAIRKRMQEIRNELPGNVDAARSKAKQWIDWRYQFRRRPLPWMFAAIALGYFVVPKKVRDKKQGAGGPTSSPGDPTSNSASQPQAVQRGFVSGLFGALATIALRTGTSVLTSRLTRLFDEQSNPFGSASEPDEVGNPQSQEFTANHSEIQYD